MGKVDGSGVGAGSDRKFRWRRFYRFFSCVGVGSEAASSFDHADAPATPPDNQPSSADLLPSSACDDSGCAYVAAAADEPELPTAACDSFGVCLLTEAPERAKLEVPTQSAAVELSRSSSNADLATSSESIDLDVADYVERCRSIKRREQSFPDVFVRMPGCRPNMLFESHASHLRKLAPWMELSYEVDDSESSVPLQEYNIDEFGKVDVSCSHQEFSEDAPQPTDFSSYQSNNTQVNVASQKVVVLKTVAAPEFFGCWGTARAPKVRLEHRQKIVFLPHFCPLRPPGHSPFQPGHVPRLAPALHRHCLKKIIGVSGVKMLYKKLQFTNSTNNQKLFIVMCKYSGVDTQKIVVGDKSWGRSLQRGPGAEPLMGVWGRTFT